MVQNDSNYRATLVILKDIEKKGLYHFNPEYHDEQFFRNFIDFQKSFSHTFVETIRKLDDFETKRDEVVSFVVYSIMSYIESHLKVFEKFLKIILDSSKLKGGFDENTTLSQILKKTCNKMQYNPKLKNAIRGLFLADFADAIISQQFLILNDGHLMIYPKDDAKKKLISIDELYDDSLQVRSIFDAMLDWADESDKPKQKQTETIDDIVRNLVSHVNSLDAKLDHIS
ncbi:hypothetical protein [Nitrosopumilus sp. S6]